MKESTAILDIAMQEADSHINDVRRKSNDLGYWVLNNLHLIHPYRLAEIKKELREFDSVKKKWK